VAAYCAKYLPAFLKTLDEYKRNDLKEALEKLFLKFDESLLSVEAQKELTNMRDACSKNGSIKADDDNDENDDEEQSNDNEVDDDECEEKIDDADELKENEKSGKSVTTGASNTAGEDDDVAKEAAALYDEACMPLEEVLKRYSNTEKKMKKALGKNKINNNLKPGLSPMITAPGSTAARNSRLKRNQENLASNGDEKFQTSPPPAKSAAELGFHNKNN
jgi:hypothetical protein